MSEQRRVVQLSVELAARMRSFWDIQKSAIFHGDGRALFIWYQVCDKPGRAGMNKQPFLTDPLRVHLFYGGKKTVSC